MSCRNGMKSAVKNLLNGESAASRSFYETLWRWSTVGCEVSRIRRSYGTKALLGRQWQRTHLSRANTRSVIPQPTTAISSQRRSNTSASTAAGVEISSEVRDDDEGSNEVLDELRTREPEKVAKPEKTESPLSHRLRALLRTLPSAAVVLTTISQTPSFRERKTKGKSNNYRGMTLSSFNSLTLSPDPVVTFSIRSPANAPSPSETLSAIHRAHHFLIHILDATPEGARIADLFTKGNETQKPLSYRPFAVGEEAGFYTVVAESIDFEGRGEGRTPLNIVLPRLQGASVRAVLKCELFRGPDDVPVPRTRGIMGEVTATKSFIRVGDHILVLGKVQEILGRGELGGEEHGGYGLSYVDGNYREVGAPLSLSIEKPEAS